MTEIIKKRIAVLKKGELPVGYKKTKAGIMPEDWDGNVRAKELFKSHTDKKHNGDLEILASTQERGIVPRSQIGIDIQCSEEGVKGYKKVSQGDFVISLRSFQGGIEYSEYDGIVSPAYTVLKPIKNISTGFYRNYFKTDSFIDRLNGAVYGIRDGKQIGYEDFGNMYVHCPPSDEQNRIAEILMQCDKIIALKQEKLNELRQLKKESLKKMFPLKGYDKPETRFPGFVDTWEQHKLLELLLQPISDGPHETPDLVDEGIPFISVEAIVDNRIDFTRKRGYITEEYDLECRKKYSPQKDDVYLVKSGATVGKVAIVETDERFNIWSPIAAMRTNKDVLLPKYLYYYFQLKDVQEEIYAKSIGGTQPNLSMRILEQFDVRLPLVEEQEKLISYFSALDNLIALHRCELEEMKNYKKSLGQLLLTGLVRVHI